MNTMNLAGTFEDMVEYTLNIHHNDVKWWLSSPTIDRNLTRF